MKLKTLVINIILIFTIGMLNSCSSSNDVSGDYLCSRQRTTSDSIEKMQFFVRENGKASVKYKGKNYKANWNGSTKQVDVTVTIYGDTKTISLISTGKFDINSEVYSMLINNKISEDACLKVLNTNTQ